jgi:hypothetical protein
MKAKLVAVTVMAAVAVSMAAMAMTNRQTREVVDEAKVQAAIDSRLHDLLVQMRMQRAGR